MSRRSRVLGGVAVGLIMLVLFPSAPVSAHSSLESTTPGANSVLEVGPPSIVLDFNAEVETGLTDIALFDANRDEIDLGSPEQGEDNTVVSVSVPELTDGLYAVIWRTTSTDGHVVDGAFAFQVGTALDGDPQELIDRLHGVIGGDASLSWWYGAARFTSLVGAILLIGGGLWSVQGPIEAVRRRRVLSLLRGGWVAMITGSLAAFGFFGARVGGGGEADAISSSAWRDALDTDTGQMLLLRSAMALVLGGLLVVVSRHSRVWWRVLAQVAAVVALVSFAAAGHPNSLEPRALWLAVDTVHLGAVVVWVGGLFVLAVVGRSTRAEAEGERLGASFSFAAAVAVPMIVITGVAQTLKLSGGLGDIAANAWGRLLLAKLVLVAALLAIAAVSHRLLRRDGAGSLGRHLVAEAALGIAIVALAAGMAAQPPESARPSQPFGQTIASGEVIASVTITPGWVGSNEVHILVTPPGGSLAPVHSVSARVSLIEEGIPLSPVTLVEEGPNHYSGLITFSRSGEWTFELVIDSTESESTLLSTMVPIP